MPSFSCLPAGRATRRVAAGAATRSRSRARADRPVDTSYVILWLRIDSWNRLKIIKAFPIVSTDTSNATTFLWHERFIKRCDLELHINFAHLDRLAEEEYENSIEDQSWDKKYNPVRLRSTHVVSGDNLACHVLAETVTKCGASVICVDNIKHAKPVDRAYDWLNQKVEEGTDAATFEL